MEPLPNKHQALSTFLNEAEEEEGAVNSPGHANIGEIKNVI